MTRILSIVFLIAALIVISPTHVHAQESGLRVTIARPAEGETLYSSPTAPVAGAPVTGWVSADDFDVRQLQVRLEVLQGAKLIGSLATTPLADGAYSFDVAINSNPEDFLASPEKGCKGNCHSLLPLGLPSGAVLLRATVTDPLGRKTTTERSIIVDQSGYADVPVRVVAPGNSQKTIEGLTVVAATRLYEWRARRYSARTDAQGSALLHIEALAQAPTRYTFFIEPLVLDGVLYRSREPIQVTLAAGVTAVEPITLIAETLRGQIDGLVIVDNRASPISLAVRVIEVPRGAAHIAKTVEGKISLAELPISKYLVAIDDEEAAAHGWQAAPRALDLSTNPITSTTLMLSAVPARAARGVVRDSAGSLLPFAWVAAGGQGKTVRVSPSSGEFALHGLSDGVRTLRVSAPGYWSRPVALSADRLDIALVRQPDTRTIPWGAGTITLPPQTIANLSGNQLTLKRGWVWGKGSGSFIISTSELEITLQAGAFALEYLSGETAWLYVREGEAQVVVDDETTALRAGQMLAFGKDVTRPSAVALDDAIVRVLHAGETSPVSIETDSAVTARLRDSIEGLGISAAQVTTFAAYLMAILAVIGALLLGRRWWLRAR